MVTLTAVYFPHVSIRVHSVRRGVDAREHTVGGPRATPVGPLKLFRGPQDPTPDAHAVAVLVAALVTADPAADYPAPAGTGTADAPVSLQCVASSGPTAPSCRCRPPPPPRPSPTSVVAPTAIPTIGSGIRPPKPPLPFPERASATIQQVICDRRIKKDRPRRCGYLNPVASSSRWHCRFCRVTCTGRIENLRSRRHNNLASPTVLRRNV